MSWKKVRGIVYFCVFNMYYVIGLLGSVWARGGIFNVDLCEWSVGDYMVLSMVKCWVLSMVFGEGFTWWFGVCMWWGGVR